MQTDFVDTNHAQLQPSNSRTPYGNPGHPQSRPNPQYQYGQTPSALQPTTYLHPPSGSYPAGEYPLQAYPPNQRTTVSTAPTNNALNTTYPSRLRTGVSVMVQPEKLTGGYQERLAYEAGQLNPEIDVGSGTGASTPTPSTPLAPSGRLSRVAASSSRRNRNGMVNYAEGNSDDEFDFEDESGSDGDFPSAHGPRPRGRPPKYPRLDGTPSLTPQQKEAAKAARRKAELEKGWSWLGERAPAERVVGVSKRKTMHVYQ
jgi:chromatin structure-remodeling complex subunit SFH1